MIGRRLLACRAGAGMVEFALLAPVFLLLLLGSMEVCRLMWITQAANEVAFNAARCLAWADGCSTSSGLQSYVTTRAAGYGLTPSSITSQASTTCNGYAGSAQVQFTVGFASPLSALIPIFPHQITVHGCFLKV